MAQPAVGDTLKIESSAARSGCSSTALLRIRIKRAVPGADPVVKSGASRTGTVSLSIPCAPGTYYAVATDYRGRPVKTKAAKLTCTPGGRPTTTPTAPPTTTAPPTGRPSTPPPTRPTVTPTATKTPTPAPSTPPSSGSVGTAEENEVVRLTNAERAKGGCGPVKHDPQLRKAAFGHSSDMAKQNYFSHTSKDGRSFTDRIREAGFTGGTSWAENIAKGQTTPASVMSSWMNSSGHKANIMNCKYNLIGVGAAKNSQGQILWTQDFAAK